MANETNLTQPWILRWGHHLNLFLRLVVDATLNGGRPIDRDHDLPGLQVNGKTLTDQREMRWVIQRTDQHLEELRARHPGESPLAYVGNGNLLANFGFVAWLAGVLYHLAAEPVFKSLYTCIVRWKDRRVTVEDLWFARENGKAIVLRKVDNTVQDITGEIEFATSGQPLVRQGKALPLEQIVEMWYDPRHLVRPLCLTLNKVTLFVPNAQLQQGLLRKALCQPVHVRLEAKVEEGTTFPLTAAGWVRLAQEEPAALARAAAFLREHGVLSAGESLEQAPVLLRVAELIDRLLREALEREGCRLMDGNGPLVEGEARLLDGNLEVFFQKALYPHTFFVRFADGTCGFVIFPGKSGHAGATLPYAQRFLTEELKVQEAILLDNGGDVRLWYRGQYLVPSSEEREEIRSLLVLTVPEGEWCGDAVEVSWRSFDRREG